jgi:hypothetical protein
MVRFAKRRVRERFFTRLCVWSEGGLEFCFPFGCTFNMLI